jgi:two-component system OmpR family sensor kinase
VSFCIVFGGLLASSYLAFYLFLVREVHAQTRRLLLEAARPVVADLIAAPNAHDVDQLDLANEYFELLEPSGHILQRSKSIQAPLDFKGMSLTLSEPSFALVADKNGRQIWAVLVPFIQAGHPRILAVGRPRDTLRVLHFFGRAALLLFPISLILTALIATWFVSRSLAPITAITEQAALMAERVTKRKEFWTPLAVASEQDELGRLARTFNQLLQGVDSALHQLRQFVTDASHELRTPLSVLHGEAELLLSRPRSAEEYRNSLSVFDDEVKKLTRIVEGLFTLSMADAGQLRLEHELLYINEVLEQASALVRPRAQAKYIAIETESKEDIAYFGDEAFLRDLFLIFLNNAVKYSRTHTTVRAGLEKLGDVIRVQFTDQGIGISSEHLPFIFERFYRAVPASGGESHSGGLGLSIALAIARAQGGSIECESKLGVGSIFTVILPCG